MFLFVHQIGIVVLVVQRHVVIVVWRRSLDHPRLLLARRVTVVVTQITHRLTVKDADGIFQEQVGRASQGGRLDNGGTPLARARVDQPVPNDLDCRSAMCGHVRQILVIGVRVGPIVTQPVGHVVGKVLL